MLIDFQLVIFKRRFVYQIFEKANDFFHKMIWLTKYLMAVKMIVFQNQFVPYTTLIIIIALRYHCSTTYQGQILVLGGFAQEGFPRKQSYGLINGREWRALPEMIYPR